MFVIAGGWLIVSIAYVGITSMKKSYGLKMISAMIRPESLGILTQVSKDEKLILGMTVTRIKGFGRQLGKGAVKGAQTPGGLIEAVREAGTMRFLPILLTSLTAIGGLLPLIIEYNPLYSPLAMVLIGGIISSTIAARFVTPVLYRLFPPKIRVEEEEIVTADPTEGAPVEA